MVCLGRLVIISGKVSSLWLVEMVSSLLLVMLILVVVVVDSCVMGWCAVLVS